MAAMGVFGVVSILMAVQAPLQVKYGHVAGRIVMLVLAGAVGVGVVVAAVVGASAMAALAEGFDPSVLTWLPLVLVFVGLLAWLISYFITRRIYERQDH